MPDVMSEQSVHIPVGALVLDGRLTVPRNARAAVVFAHGSGSSRTSPRNRFVAGMLQEAGLATLLFDLLSHDEARLMDNRFDIDRLTERLLAATHWLRSQAQAKDWALGYFGASTGSAAALRAATELGPVIGAVVSRGGRPDLAEPVLSSVQAPVLFIIGSNDHQVLELNQRAYRLITADKDLQIVPGATHLFEEPGALEEVARLAARWFSKHLLASRRVAWSTRS